MDIWLVLVLVGLAVYVLNLPFGYWRANTRRFSLAWILAVHVPVPFIVMLRLVAGLGWRLGYILPMVGCFFLGQFAGGVVRRRLAARGWSLTSCLVMDLARHRRVLPTSA